ncbi:hypothetical protein MMC30_005288 [Trapelia coarctata]|nr:hypothetical protein [Trapelia coarctata]
MGDIPSASAASSSPIPASSTPPSAPPPPVYLPYNTNAPSALAASLPPGTHAPLLLTILSFLFTHASPTVHTAFLATFAVDSAGTAQLKGLYILSVLAAITSLIPAEDFAAVFAASSSSSTSSASGLGFDLSIDLAAEMELFARPPRSLSLLGRGLCVSEIYTRSEPEGLCGDVQTPLSHWSRRPALSPAQKLGASKQV